jgi:hypothetical protein
MCKSLQDTASLCKTVQDMARQTRTKKAPGDGVAKGFNGCLDSRGLSSTIARQAGLSL